MPLRDILLTIVGLGSLPYSFLHPWIGVLVWSWLGYMNPHRVTWGFSKAIPFAQLVAIATLAGLLLTKDRRPLPKAAEVYLLIALWGVFFLSTLFSIYPQEAWPQLNKVSKILLMTFVTLLLFQDRERLRILLYVIALSLGFWGLKGGVWAVVTGGNNQVLGPEGSFIAGNTEIGLALNMTLPLLLFLRRDETRIWLRHLLLVMFCFTIIATLITYSRGAFLGLGIVLSLLFLKSRMKIIVVVLLAVGIPLASVTLPQHWFKKMDTIQNYEQDNSAMNRLKSWSVAVKIARDRPLLGGGFRPFSPEIYQRYTSEESKRGADAHSIYFQVLAEHGFTGLGLYLGLILSTMVSLRRMMWRSRGDPSMQWAYNYCQMLEASLVAYLVCGAFLSLSYFDLFFHLVAIVALLKQVVWNEQREKVKAPAYKIIGARLPQFSATRS